MTNWEEYLDDLESSSRLKDREWGSDLFQRSRTRYLNTLNLFDQVYEGGKILDAGCYPGYITYCLESKGYPISGVDIAPDRIQSVFKADNVNLDIYKCDIEKDRLPFKDNLFSTVILTEVFEHLRIDPIHTLREINRILEPSGKLLLTTPNVYSIATISKIIRGRGIVGNVFDQYKKIETEGHMGHARLYSLYEIEDFLRNTSYDILDSEYLTLGDGYRNTFARGLEAIPYLRHNIVCVASPSEESL